MKTKRKREKQKRLKGVKDVSSRNKKNIQYLVAAVVLTDIYPDIRDPHARSWLISRCAFVQNRFTVSQVFKIFDTKHSAGHTQELIARNYVNTPFKPDVQLHHARKYSEEPDLNGSLYKSKHE